MIDYAVMGYAAAALAYALLALLLLINWRGQLVGGLLVVACGAGIGWAGLAAAALAGLELHDSWLFASEVLRSGAWILFLGVLLSRLGIGRRICLIANAAWIAVLFGGLVIQWFPAFEPVPAARETLLFAGSLVVALIGLVLLEQLHRIAPAESRSAFKPLVIGLGALFAYDIFLFSQGVLIGQLDSIAYFVRGAVSCLAVPLIALAARRNPAWELDIFVSRQVVFYSTSIAAVGVYLLAMSGVGYWISIHGGTWGSVARMVFLVGAVLILSIAIFSSSLRARLKVLLNKHFFRNKYDYREEWLRLTETLSAFEDSSTRQIVIKALAQIVQSPSGHLWLISEDRRSLHHAAGYGTSEVLPAIPVDEPLVRFIIEHAWLVDLVELSEDPELYGHLRIPDCLQHCDSAWLIVPLMSRHELLGLVMLSSAPGVPELNYEDRDLLKTVGNHVAVHLAQDRTSALLSEARQFEAYNRLTAFLMHDLNNLIAQQSLLVSNAVTHKRNPDFVDDAMNTISGSVDRMKRIMDQLKRGQSERVRKPTDIRFIVSTAVERCAGRRPQPTLVLEDADATVVADPEEFTMVLTHLIKNAQDSTSADGLVELRSHVANGRVKIEVRDDGMGMSEAFVRDRLFRPFDSTKGSQGMGIGAYQAREFARKIGGELSVESRVGEGSTITLALPVSVDTEATAYRTDTVD